ncbi:MAG TPA: tyrosinase family protein [Steroidobacteraceae bacterium]|nr:tyrosinase family protein [Steroidobacteraceae bacterium]
MEVLTSADLAADFSLQDRSRRIFIQGVGLVGVGLIAGTLGGCDKLAEAIRNRPLRRRLRTGSPEVDAAIDLYRQAVTQMKGLAAADPRSWTAQATIHGTPSGFNFCQHNTNHFFDWHRAYLFYFEKICQKLTGNSKFGLPYWNWNQNEDIHPAFLDPASTLYLARNRTSMAGWFATTTSALDPIMGDTNLFSFSQQIEGTPHNSVHSYIGGTLGGYTSALDPLFWMHHCMVDYCWAKWNLELGNDNTNDSTWLGTDHSHFVDADGNAASVTAGITTLMPLLSYRYESSAIGSSPAQAEAAMTKSHYKKLEERVRKGADVRFDIKRRARLAERTAVSIARPFSVDSKISAAELAGIVEADPSREVVFASIEYAQLPASSDFSVRVFVNLPGADATTPIDDPHYAGSFAFFGTEPGDAGAEHRQQPKFLVNLTPTLQRLRSRQDLKASGAISVQLVPTPFAGGFEKADTELVLNGLDIIVTPVIVRAKTG